MTIAQNTPLISALLDRCRRHADANVGPLGHAATPVPGLAMVRLLHPGELQVAVQKPLIAMLLQGRKRVSTHGGSFEYSPGEAMVIAADTPTVSQVTKASLAAPYYALVLELDPAILSDLSAAAPALPAETRSIRVEPLAADVVDAALRLVRLLDQPEALAALGGGLLRELHYWLLMGVHGPAIRALGAPDSHAARIGRAVGILRRDFARAIRVDELADAARMSEPAFHRHFQTDWIKRKLPPVSRTSGRTGSWTSGTRRRSWNGSAPRSWNRKSSGIAKGRGVSCEDYKAKLPQRTLWSPF